MNPGSGLRSKMAQAKNYEKQAKTGAKRAKAAKSKTAKFDKALVLHHLLFMLFAALLTLVALIPLYPENVQYSIPKLIFIGLSAIFLLLGIYHNKRATKRFNWFDSDGTWPEFGILFSVGALVYLCMSMLLYFLYPLILGTNSYELTRAYSFLWPLSATALFIPHLYKVLASIALRMESKEYKLWFYPRNYKEKQPTWNRERKVVANLKFVKDPDIPVESEVQVTLPMEAEFGEMFYLWLQDFNNRRSPEDPIKELYSQANDVGWLFAIERKGFFGKLSPVKRIIDPELTVEQNGILNVGEEIENIVFHRVRKNAQG